MPVVALRPLGLAEILDGSFGVLRRYPRIVLGAALVVAVVEVALLAIVQKLLDTALVDPGRTPGDPALAFSWSAIAASLLVGGTLAVGVTAVVAVVVTDDLLGRPVHLGPVLARVAGSWRGLLGLALFVGPVPVLGLAAFGVLGVWLWGIWALAVPALIAERASVRQALGRSVHLVRGSFWRVWGIRALSVAVASVVNALVTVPFAVLAQLASGGDLSDLATGRPGLPALYLLITSIGSVIATTVTGPVRSGVEVLLYVDQRMRREGLDLDLQDARLEAVRP